MEINIENKKSHIYIKVTGQVSLNVAEWNRIRAARTDILSLIKKSNIYKLLFDCLGVSARLSILDRFLIATFLAKENYNLISNQGAMTKIALVINPSMIDVDRFGEKVANNRGLYGLLTDNMQEALAWLDLSNAVNGEH